MQAAVVSTNLQAAIRTLKKLEARDLEQFLNSQDLMKSLGLTSVEEKAVVQAYKRNENVPKEGWWV